MQHGRLGLTKAATMTASYLILYTPLEYQSDFPWNPP